MESGSYDMQKLASKFILLGEGDREYFVRWRFVMKEIPVIPSERFELVFFFFSKSFSFSFYFVKSTSL